jgi:hypothetical protein
VIPRWWYNGVSGGVASDEVDGEGVVLAKRLQAHRAFPASKRETAGHTFRAKNVTAC